MRAEGVAFLLAEAAFEERAEDDGLDACPVFLGGFKEQADFVRASSSMRFDFGKQAAVEIIHAGVACRRARVWRRSSAGTARRSNRSWSPPGFPSLAAFVQQAGEQDCPAAGRCPRRTWRRRIAGQSAGRVRGVRRDATIALKASATSLAASRVTSTQLLPKIGVDLRG